MNKGIYCTHITATEALVLVKESRIHRIRCYIVYERITERRRITALLPEETERNWRIRMEVEPAAKEVKKDTGSLPWVEK